MSPTSALRWLAVIAVAVGLCAPAAFAATPAEKTAQLAKVAYEKGSFEEAARLFFQAWQQDPAVAGWLYSAARSAEKAGLWDDAAERYQAFLKNPAGAEAMAPQAEAHLKDVQNERVKIFLRKAEDAADPSLGYRHAAKATQLAPDNLQVWFVAAELADKAEMREEALAAYKHVLRLAPAGSAESKVASKRTAALSGAPVADEDKARADADRADQLRKEADRKDAERKAADQREAARLDRERREQLAREGDLKPPPPKKPRPPVVISSDAGFPWGPVVTLTLGLGAAAFGGTRLKGALDDETKLHDQTWGALQNSPTKLIQLGYADAKVQAKDIGDRKLIGASVLGAGGAAVIVGLIWWAVRGPDDPTGTVVTLAPARDGIWLSVQF